ncbi:MAG: hypothetical protein NTZ92_05015 [Candidatus Omnitrophica bacterium]|nr:hypothetical protein [Candidatus Omnitrophota bacterium]
MVTEAEVTVAPAVTEAEVMEMEAAAATEVTVAVVAVITIIAVVDGIIADGFGAALQLDLQLAQ